MAVCTQYRRKEELVVFGIWSEVAGVVITNQAGTAPDELLFDISVVYTSQLSNWTCSYSFPIIDGWSDLTRLEYLAREVFLGKYRVWSDEPVTRSELLGFVDCYIELRRSDLRTLDDRCHQL